MVGRGEDTLDHAYHRHHYFWFWSDAGTVRHFAVMVELQQGPIPTFLFHLFRVVSLPIHLYLVDTFTYAASALSAASVRLSPTFQ